MTKGILLILTATILLVGGCLRTEITDPNTGQKFTTYQLDPNKIALVETGAEGAAGMANILGLFIPGASAIGGAIVTALGIWRKVKPKLIEAQTKQKMYYSATESVVTGIEDFKEKYPAEWEKLKDKLTTAIGPEAENIIRALRGLPAKT